MIARRCRSVVLALALACAPSCIVPERFATNAPSLHLPSMTTSSSAMRIAQTGDVQDFYCSGYTDCDAHLPGKGTWCCQPGHFESPTGGMCVPRDQCSAGPSSGDGASSDGSSGGVSGGGSGPDCSTPEGLAIGLGAVIVIAALIYVLACAPDSDGRCTASQG